MTSAQSLIRTAPAKINLALAVAPPQSEDGLHPICSWFIPVSLFDSIQITRLGDPGQRVASEYEIEWAPNAVRPSAIDWPLEKDLAVRAHRLLEQEAQNSLPVRLSLRKRIPVGAGLGGGSSNAAAALLAIRTLFSLDISDARLRELSTQLGSDVAFFLPPSAARSAVVEGLGDRIERVPRVDARFLLALPDFGCPTGAVYKAFDESPPAKFRADEIREMATDGRLDTRALFNDLADPATRVQPKLAEIMSEVKRIAASPAHLTGSGSAVFVILPRADHEREATLLKRLRSDLPSCAAMVVGAA
ncbi:MAG: 4-(cytidine 5'-diphospho)-2-C-methyl-D-erythritol kinase [Planctomycetota bacterium]|nr:4-(cytidine 5'-diphospho)-2-C-methyl-D-erythritol kinase [Planctomycetota bacterium]